MTYLKQLVDKFMKEYVDLQEGQTLAEAKEVIMTSLVSNGMMIIDYDFGEKHVVIKNLESTIEKGFIATIHNVTNLNRRSQWFGSGRNVRHNLSILCESPMLMTFIERMLGSTRGVVANVYGQYYKPSKGKSSHMHWHFSIHQYKFYTHYCLITTLGDSRFGKKMMFAICEVKPCIANPGKSVTINIPHGQTVLLPRSVGGVTAGGPVWHGVYNCENTMTITFEVFHHSKVMHGY
jgi:hypothetical protein